MPEPGEQFMEAIFCNGSWQSQKEAAGAYGKDCKQLRSFWCQITEGIGCDVALFEYRVSHESAVGCYIFC